MTRRNLFAALLALVTAAICVRLGFWQLDRLDQRRARNADVAARLSAPAIPVALLPADTAAARWRRVRLEGTWDFDREIALTGRSRAGSPGVNLITPLRLHGDTLAVLVNRGWVYSPDATTVDLALWREPDRAAIEGYALTIPAAQGTDPRSSRDPRAWHALDAAYIADLLPYPVAPFYVVALADTVPRSEERVAAGGREGTSTPARLVPPVLDDGSHWGYAVQWFSFAVIAIVGVSALIWQDLRARRVERTVEPEAPLRAL
ncbi:MAG: SURF1 family protein [Gemmatimonadota bacterium]|nr:SURF1 family protein [Gemmatimonadota bacterium]